MQVAVAVAVAVAVVEVEVEVKNPTAWKVSSLYDPQRHLKLLRLLEKLKSLALEAGFHKDLVLHPV